VGVPWQGEPGITETVSEIMDREAASPQTARLASDLPYQACRRPEGRAGILEDHPWVQAISQWPPAQQILAVEVTPTVVFPQPVGTGFLGAALNDTLGSVPPDSMGAVGPSQVLVIVNGRIRVFDKEGHVGLLNTTTDNFFSAVRSAATSDPHVRYDRLSQRWFITMIDIVPPNRVLIAVSSGPVITGTSSFRFFQFRLDGVGPTPNSDTGGLADYDTLGVDRFALYIGANVFTGADTTKMIGATGFVVRKADLLAGLLTVTAFRQMGAAAGTGPGISTPQGVDNDDPNAAEGYFIGPDNQYYGLLDIVRISDPCGTPVLSASLQLTVPRTTSPIPQAHAGDVLSTRLDAVDDRLFGAAIHKNKITGASSLWTAHNIEVNSSGVAQRGGGRNGSRWYEIGGLTTTPTVIQLGTLFDGAARNPRGFWIPTVVGTGQGHMGLGCSYASANDYAGVAVAGRLRTDPPGTIRPPTLAVVSESAYNLTRDGNPHRWGDYSAIVVDPNDDMTMWAFQEYTRAPNTWGVQAIQLKALPPATPSSALPAVVVQGLSAVDVVITGTSTSGSEFFDPGADVGGPGFANQRIFFCAIDQLHRTSLTDTNTACHLPL
jgi:hypothetical protein